MGYSIQTYAPFKCSVGCVACQAANQYGQHQRIPPDPGNAVAREPAFMCSISRLVFRLQRQGGFDQRAGW